VFAALVDTSLWQIGPRAGFIGQLLQVTGVHVSPSPDVPSVMLWGDKATVRERLRDGIAHVQLTPVMASLHDPFSESETVESYRRYYGPPQHAFAAHPEDKQPNLRRDLENLWAQYNHATDGTTHIEAEYLEVVAMRV
jgi:hypothetical protein